MNMIETMQSINRFGKYLLIMVLALNFVGIISSSGDGTDTPSGITQALTSLCNTSKTFLTMSIIIMVILAGAVYAIGQIMGAETRARATVWATSMLTGAIIGVLIYVLLPVILNLLLSEGDRIDFSTCTLSGSSE